VTLTLAAALAAITTTERVGIGTVSAIGLIVWVVGIGLEVIAVAQKSCFCDDTATTESYTASYTLSLHGALPIFSGRSPGTRVAMRARQDRMT
jgi:steroid 5-alpha reductase family enzyme